MSGSPRSAGATDCTGRRGWWLSPGARVCDGGTCTGGWSPAPPSSRGFVREAVGDVYRYALALTVSTTRAEQLTTSAAVRLARHVDAVGAAPVSTARLNLSCAGRSWTGCPAVTAGGGHAHAEAAAPARVRRSGHERPRRAGVALGRRAGGPRAAALRRAAPPRRGRGARRARYPEAERILQSARTHLARARSSTSTTAPAPTRTAAWCGACPVRRTRWPTGCG